MVMIMDETLYLHFFSAKFGDSSDDDVGIVDMDDDDPFNQVPSSSRKTTTQLTSPFGCRGKASQGSSSSGKGGKAGKSRGVTFDSDSDDDFPKPKRKQ